MCILCALLCIIFLWDQLLTKLEVPSKFCESMNKPSETSVLGGFVTLRGLPSLMWNVPLLPPGSCESLSLAPNLQGFIPAGAFVAHCSYSSLFLL